MTQQEKVGAKSEQVQVQGETIIEDNVIASIAGVAAREIAGVAALGTSSIRSGVAERFTGRDSRARGVAVEAGKKEAILDLTFKVIYGYSIPNIVVEVRQNVAERVLQMTGLIAKEVNIRVVDIDFPERMPGRLE